MTFYTIKKCVFGVFERIRYYMCCCDCWKMQGGAG